MKYLVLTTILVAASARSADACGVLVFAAPSSEPAVVEPPPPASQDTGLATKLIGGLLVVSVLSRWMFAPAGMIRRARPRAARSSC
jgi:hypothetical protein